MATEDHSRGSPEAEKNETQQDLPTTTQDATTRKRPRIDLTVETRERKRGKTMFGLLVGTLKKAKSEDKERGASDAARKRQLIDQRLQDKLKKETDSVRRAEEAKKDKTAANRKEEELQLKDSVYKLRRTRLPLLANFLSTADRIPSENDMTDSSSSTNPLAPLPKSHPPPLFYLPAILTPAQEAFLKRRKAEVKEAAEKEWETFHAERAAGIEEIQTLRARVAEEEASRPKPPPRAAKEKDAATEDVKMSEEPEPEPEQEVEKPAPAPPKDEGPPGLVPPEHPPEESKAPASDSPAAKDSAGAAAMDVDDGATRTEAPAKVSPPKAAAATAQVDEDDAVEY